MTVALVVGYGSIGKRHVRLLRQLGCTVGVVSRRRVEEAPVFASITEALNAQVIDYVVIANETSAHAAAVKELRSSGFGGALLIEKPLGDVELVDFGAPVAVAYNLRFHPVVSELKRLTDGEKIVSVNAYCGQFLPDWRPDADYRKGYSAHPERGGGVLRDLSHELDYLMWLYGPWRRVVALGGRLGNLEINSDDCWSALAELERCACVAIHVDYLDRPGRRHIVINTVNHTHAADIVSGKITTDGVERGFPVERDDTYIAQHRAMLTNDRSRLCTAREGARVMQLIAAIEASARDQRWVAS